MTGREFRAIRLRLGLTQVALGKVLDVTEKTVRRWERGEVSLPRMAAYALQYLELRTQGRSRAKAGG